MSASQGLSAARRRRAGPPSTVGPSPPGSNNTNRPQSLQGSNGISGGNKQISVQSLLIQHEKRLAEIEKQVPHALATINSNIEVLKEGYNSLSSGEIGPSILDERTNSANVFEAPKEVQDEIVAIDTKINTALSEALSVKNIVNSLTVKLGDVSVDTINQLVDNHKNLLKEHEETKRELAELRSIVDELRNISVEDEDNEITFGVAEGKE
jgi:hypothetical protein